ncbi:acetyl-CoA synthetase-like protein, partial [Aspergillus campestris IBT 28561]
MTPSPASLAQLASWNGKVPDKAKTCVHWVVDDQCKSQPEAPALCTERETLSYGELADTSSKMAAYLEKMGIGPGQFVPLCFEKSKWTTLAMLAVMKVGAAFVLLDPSYPIQRLKEICQAVEADVVLCSGRNISKSAQIAPQVVPVDWDESTWSRHKAEQLPSTVQPCDALYAVFTSGSTGKPKGIIIEHGSFSLTAQAYLKTAKLDTQMRALQFASYGFDVSISDMLVTLMAGGCICIPSDAERVTDLAESISRMGVNFADLTPSVLRSLSPADVPSIQTLVLGGETMSKTIIEKWKGHVRLLNAYGPAECCMLSTIQCNVSTSDPSNIGYATGGVCWVVDKTDYTRLVPVGAVGELLIEGPVVGRGYIHEPERTSQSFIEEVAWLTTFRGSSRSRLFRTGDLVRYNPDGSLVFIGRKDTQVKLRGQRIELGEVEHHTRECFPEAGDVVAEVVTPNETARPPILVAFIFPGSPNNNSTDIIAAPTDLFRSTIPAAEAQLHDRVPGYMVPAVFLPLATIPLTATGKTDRRRLRDHAATLSRAEIESYNVSITVKRMPVTETEWTLQSLWGQVLNMPSDAIGVDDTFFRLGGDSITAMQLSSLARAAGLSLTVSDIFQFKSISGLASIRNTKQPVSSDPEESVDVAFDLSPVQRLYFELAPRASDYCHQSTLIPLAASVAPDDLARAIPILVDRHSMLRARFSLRDDGTWSQAVSADIKSSYRYRHITVRSLEDARLSMQNSQRTLDIQHGPLFNVELITTGSRTQEQYIFLLAHRLVMDAASWPIILGDLEELLEKGQIVGAKPLPFQSWCRLLGQYARKSRLPPEALYTTPQSFAHGYWGPMNIPNTWDNTLHDSFTVSEQVTATLLGKANDSLQTQPAEVLLAALWYSFERIFQDRPRPTIFNEDDGREPWDTAIDLSRTVGWLTTMWPVCINLDSNIDDIVEVVRRVKDSLRQASSNRWAYTAFCFMNSDGQNPMKMHGPVEIAFNYLGLDEQHAREESMFQSSINVKDHVPNNAPDTPRLALVDVEAAVKQSRLQISFRYNRQMQHQKSIRRWIANYKESLQEAAERLTSIDRMYTLCDFPLLPLTYESLESLLHEIRTRGSRQEIEDIYPCSPIQRGIIISQAKDPRYYRTSSIWKVVANQASSPVDLVQLQTAWRQVVDRHAILRTYFVESVSRAAYVDQVVLATAVPECDIVATRRVEDPIAAIEQYFATAGQQGQPLHRMLVYATETEILCALNISHALIDGQSMGILERDLRLAYDGKLPPGRGSLYSDYISYLQGFSECAAETYWKAYMDGVEPCVFPKLGAERVEDDKRTQRNTFADLGTGENLRAFCQRHEVTLSNLFGVAWAVVLQIYTGLDSVCFGYVNSGRDVPVHGVGDIIGPLINMLVCRLDLASDKSMLSLVQSNRDQYLKSLPHQFYPLADIMHWTGMSGMPLFNTAISIERSESGEDEVASVGLEKVGGHDPTEYDISVNVGIGADRMRVHLNYWTSSLSEQRAECVTETFKTVILAIAERPESTARELNATSEWDKQQIYAWNAEVPEPVNRCVHDLIVEQCQARPDSTAVCAWDGDLTYCELDQLSSTLAVHLFSLGIKPGVFVPLCFEKSRWITVAILGVMKAGGAFVLLDPSHPQARLQGICRAVSADVIIVSAASASLVDTAGKVLVVVDSEAAWQENSIAWAQSTVTPDSDLYAVFTSGSTGTPKGVIISHSAFCSSSLRQSRLLSLTSHSRVLQFASYTFDPCISDMLGSFLVGACVCVPSEIDRKTNIPMVISRMNIDWADLTPSVARILNPADMPSLKTLILSGEPPMANDDVETWSSHVQLINSYGPAECAVVSVTHNNLRMGSDPKSIGWGTGCVCWVVDPVDHEQLMPIGAVGELLIEGPIVGRGYLNSPELTAAAFIHPPGWLCTFREMSPGKERSSANRLYKTGDLVQYAVDGSLRYIGRKDTQVKLRGQRIELGEVEHHVRQCFVGVRDVVAEVVAPADRPPLLVAFVWIEGLGNTGRGDRSEHGDGSNDILAAPSDAFRAAVPVAEADLHKAVPSYMVPAVFLPLVASPLTATGKTDRRRLRHRAAALSRPEIEAYSGPAVAKRAPATAAERMVQGIWARVLNVLPESISSDDSFFRLGGDSITAMRLAGAAREEGVFLAVADIFQHPTLSELAHCLQTTTINVDVGDPFSLLDPSTRDAILQLAMHQCHVPQDRITDIYPCTPLQEGLIALTEKTADAYTARFSYRLPGDLDLNRLRAAWNAVARANPILNTRIIHGDGLGTFQVVLPDDIPWVVDTHRDVNRVPGKPVSFGLGNPLFYVAIIQGKSGNMPSQLILNMHHAVYDAWSLPLLLEQVEAAFHGESLALRPFSPFVAYISRAKATSNAFWRSEFMQLDTVCFPPYSGSSYVPNPTECITHTVSLPQDRPGDFTVSTTLRLAWAITLSQYTNSEDVVFGLTVSGRGAAVAGIDKVTGPTIATVPLRVRLEQDETITNGLHRVQSQSARMLPFEQTGLQNIRRLSDETAAACRFQNLLVIQPRPVNVVMELFSEDGLTSDHGAYTSYALILLCELSPEMVTVHAMHDAQVIGTTQVQRLLHHLSYAIEQIEQQPDMLLKDMSKVGREDYKQLAEWNAVVPERVNQCVHDLIIKQCQTRPDALAVSAWDGDLTYSRLDQLSSALAAYLSRLGVGPDIFVPLCFEKSRWIIIAIMGVIKAGGAFILLDPSYPLARLRSICNAVSAGVIVTSTANAAIANDLAAQVVVLTNDNDIWQEGNWLGSSVTPNHALYAVFTSGSTGSPKAVVIEHASFSTASISQIEAKQFPADLRLFQFTSYAFDPSISDILITLLLGGCVCTPSEVDRRENIAQAIAQLQANWVELTPSFARTLDPRNFEGIHTLVMGGEAAIQSDMDRWSPYTKLITCYGPAECSIVSCVQPRNYSGSDPRNIGWGTGCVCWVVDPADHEKLLPVGAVGELLIEGPVVGRGYLNDPVQTAAAFINPPAWLRLFRATSPGNTSGDRLYKTGDLVQYAVDGSLQFVGRKDTQVKLRGQRIELGEVEHYVRQCFVGARDVVAEVVTPAGVGQPPLLVAFVLMEGQDATKAAENGKTEDILATPTSAFRAVIPAVESALHDTVPVYMVPAVFLQLKIVPLTTTGKTDRRRLCSHVASLSRSDIEAYHSFPAAKRLPTTAAEQTLQRLWAQVLHVPLDTIGADDSIFRLGGDSIIAMQLTAAAREDGFALSVADIFLHRRLSTMAR